MDRNCGRTGFVSRYISSYRSGNAILRQPRVIKPRSGYRVVQERGPTGDEWKTGAGLVREWRESGDGAKLSKEAESEKEGLDGGR